MSFIVWRDGPPNTVALDIGDSVVTYELAEQEWPWSDLPPHGGHTQALLDYQNAVMAYANRSDDDWRIQRDVHCDCRQRRVVAQLLVHEPSKRLWAVVKPERVPSAFRKGSRPGNEGWALHGREGEAPHVGAVSSCKGCGQRWLVVSFVDRIELLRIVGATHGAQIAP